MGLAIDQELFDEESYERFGRRLKESLDALRLLLERPGFGRGPTSIGAELELFLIDGKGEPAGINRDVLAELVDPRFGVELDRFNIEFNASPVEIAGRPFAAIGDELRDGLEGLDAAAQQHHSRVVAIGILPSLTLEQLQSSAMTDLPRYRALSAGIRRVRRRPFEIHIDGTPPLHVHYDDVTIEGANTSLQLHLRVAPEDFACTYNAAQIATAPVLAAAGNSPFFAGRRLWEETRIALFKQAVDTRPPDSGEHLPARVAFGRGWSERDAYEHFADSVALHAALLPIVGDEDAAAVVRKGATPLLDELRLHHGTVWSWNRAVYDPKLGGHLRIEMRSLPAGPTVVDMMANAALLIGLTLALAPSARKIIDILPFEEAERNFYRAAKHGLRAELLWPFDEGHACKVLEARELIPRLLPIARRGLSDAGVLVEESDRLLDIIGERVASGQTGASWQVAQRDALDPTTRTREVFAELVVRYADLCRDGRPVHTWPIHRT